MRERASSSTAGSAKIAVADTGEGIAPEDQRAVFEEFRQVGTASKEGPPVQMSPRTIRAALFVLGFTTLFEAMLVTAPGASRSEAPQASRPGSSW